MALAVPEVLARLFPPFVRPHLVGRCLLVALFVRPRLAGLPSLVDPSDPPHLADLADLARRPDLPGLFLQAGLADLPNLANLRCLAYYPRQVDLVDQADLADHVVLETRHTRQDSDIEVDQDRVADTILDDLPNIVCVDEGDRGIFAATRLGTTVLACKFHSG